MTNQIILVDDEESIRDSCPDFIEHFVPGTSVVSFASGYDLFKALAVDEPYLHSAKAICLDGYLNNERGQDIARELRNEYGYKGEIILIGALGTLKLPDGPIAGVKSYILGKENKITEFTSEEISHFDHIASKPAYAGLTDILANACKKQ
ncbi:MAG TPA: hypothetical protein VKE88_01700 [Candidatus Nanoarchaeia archaeon]|nr:hypothetical protein [Candidatus Nanoarchaeia archaeon]